MPTLANRLNQNQDRQSNLPGKTDLGLNHNTVAAMVDGSVTDADAILPGQPVKLVNSNGGVPKVVPVENNDDQVDGVALYNIKNIDYKAEQALEIAGQGDCVYMETNGAIERGTNVSLDASNKGLVGPSSAARTHVGYAFDGATEAGQLIRVILFRRTRFELPSRAKGNLYLRAPFDVVKAVAHADINVGAPVEVRDGNETTMRVQKANAVGDRVFGYVFNDGKASYDAGDFLYVATGTSVIYLEATAAIDRGAVGCLDLGDGTIDPSTASSTITGTILEKASANEIVRVRLELPSFRTAS